MKTIYWFCYTLWKKAFITFFSYRVIGKEKLVTDGPVLIASNHESFLDPPLVGIAYDQEVYYLARKTLFRGIGRVFELLGEIIKMIIDKIVSLPDCVPYYSMGAGKGMTKEFLPRWIYNIITFFHKAGMFWLNLFKPLLKLIGIDIDAWQDEINRKCYKFNTKRKTDEREVMRR